MSYNPPPPPVHPKTTTQTRPVYKMAAIQLPPLGPHAFLPSPPAGQYHENFPMPHFPGPLSSAVFHKPQEGNTQRKVTSPRTPNSRITYQSPLKKRQSAVPVESLLQSEPYSPSYSKAISSPRSSTQISPRTVTGPSILHSGPLKEQPVPLHIRQEPFDSRGRYSVQDDQRYSTQLPSSPSRKSHRDSAASCHSSGTSSSDLRPGSVVPSQITLSLPGAPAQPVQPHL